MAGYDPKVTPWMVGEAEVRDGGTPTERLTALVRYAILAPSSHNTQPWKFTVGADTVDLLVDTERWLRVADAEQRELYLSAGCALENLLIASAHFGYDAEVALLPEPARPELAARVRLTPSASPATAPVEAWFAAIPLRCTNHQVYDGRPVFAGALQRLRACGIAPEITIFLTSDPEIKRRADDLVVRADALQFADPSFREELGYWIGQGVFGSPWLMAKLGQLAVTYVNIGKSQAKKDSELLLSAPVLGMITARRADRVTQVQAGQVFERVYLEATALGLSLQPVSQILQVPELQSEVRSLLPDPTFVPLQPFRLGYAVPEAEHTPRRPLEEMLVTE